MRQPLHLVDVFAQERYAGNQLAVVTDAVALDDAEMQAVAAEIDFSETTFVETIVESLSDEPANYNEIKRINWGEAQPGGDVETLELGPNNCAAN